MSGLEKLGRSVETKLSKRKTRIENSMSFYDFFRESFSVLEPGTILVENWHMKYLCDLIEEEVHRVAEGKPKKHDYVINLIFRSLKSMIFSVCLHPWVWTMYPHMSIGNASYGEKLAFKFSSKSKELIKSKWYQNSFGDSFKYIKDQQSKSLSRNNRGGERIAVSVGGSITGDGANIWVVDDPVKPPEKGETGLLKAEIRKANAWFDDTFYSRLNQPTVDLRVILAQRVNISDMSSYVMKGDKDSWKHICIPARLEDNVKVKPARLINNYEDGLFFKKRFPHSQLDKYKKKLKNNYSGQVLQMPMEDEGTYWEEKMFNAYPDEKMDKLLQSGVFVKYYWDLATSGKRKNSANAWIKCFIHENALFIDDFGYFWAKSPTVKEEIISKEKEGTCYIENKSAGESLIPMLQEEGYDVIDISHSNQDKIQNTQDALMRPVVKNRNLFVRDSIYDELLGLDTDENPQSILAFPNASKDDVNDTLCMAVNENSKYITGHTSVEKNVRENREVAVSISEDRSSDGFGSIGADFSSAII